MISLDLLSEERIKICSECPNKTSDWKCGLTNDNVIVTSRIRSRKCPEDRWRKKLLFFKEQNQLKEGPETKAGEGGTVSPEVQNGSEGCLLANIKLKTSLISRPVKSLLNSKSSVEKIIYCAENYPPGSWPDNFHTWENTQTSFRCLMAKHAAKIVEEKYPANRFKGKGIVVVGGGLKYFPSVYVNIRMLRLLGCELPVEVFYLGEREMDFRMIRLMGSIPNVKCINGRDLEDKYPIRIHAGWEAKIYAIINCSFEEVLMLDADNTPLDNPIHLFYENPYLEKGAILWPDYSCWVHDKKMWQILGIEYRDELQIESGQILINKKKCWKEINLAKYYCDFSDYYFKIFYGDKETFHFGWRYFGSEYVEPPGPDWVNNCVIMQKNLDGSWMFSHRAQAKFKLDKTHTVCNEVPYEEDTLELLDELNELWYGEIWINTDYNEEELELENKLVNRTYQYVRVGKDSREMELLPDGVIGEGGDKLERKWYLFVDGGITRMSIHGEEGLTALLVLQDEKWAGYWVDHERFLVELK